MKRIKLYLVLMLVVSALFSQSYGAEKWPGKVSDFFGFERYTFTFGGKSAWVKLPKKAAPGNPWVWRGRWADFHSGTDVILLKRGFHIAYLDTGNMLGCNEALNLWDSFYIEMTQKYGLSNKVALEAVSRGGLFVLRWASRHPYVVTCIYLDSAVCDIKSWPLGRGKGDHDTTGLKHLEISYGLKTEEDILNFKGNPVDDAIIKPIAAAKIPILAIANKDDHIVPPSENIEVFAKKYKELGGGDIEIMHPVDGAKTSLKGHHFPVPNPKKSADFIETNTMKIVK